MRIATVSLLAPLLAAVAWAQAPEVPIVHETKGEFSADALYFETRIEIDASCAEVFTSLTDMKRVGALVPHLRGKAKVTKAANPGDTMWYEFERKDGSKNSGRFILTTIEENSRVQFLVQPDAGPWLRVQEFRLFAPAAGSKRKTQCAVIYEETYNPKPLKNAAYDVKEIIQEIRAPYMQIILRRLKNLSEGKEPGPPREAAELTEIAKTFP
jgi:uncharacterized protein YndB with AHSA1/START domain